MSVVIDLTNKVTDRDIPSGANLDESKLQHRHKLHYGQAGGANATAFDHVLDYCYKGGGVLAAYVTPDVVPSGDKTLTVDLKLQSAPGGAWASILSSTLEISSADTNATPQALSLSGTPTFVAGNTLKAVGTLGGANGTGVQGFSVDVITYENCS